MDYEYVLTEKKGRIGYVILNRPKKLNALNKAFVGEIVDALEGMDDDREVRVIVIKGNGRAFTAGADLAPDQPKPNLGCDDRLRLQEGYESLDRCR